MGLSTLNQSLKNDVEARSKVLRDAYMIYRILGELARTDMLIKDLELKVDANDEKLKNLKSIAKQLAALGIQEKIINPSIMDFNESLYPSLLNKFAVENELKNLELNFKESYFYDPEKKSYDFTEIAYHIHTGAIYPAMNQLPWNSSELLTLSAGVIMTVLLGTTVNALSLSKELPPLEYQIIVAMVIAPALLIVWALNQHRLANKEMSRLGNDNRAEVNETISAIMNTKPVQTSTLRPLINVADVVTLNNQRIKELAKQQENEAMQQYNASKLK